MSGSHLYFGFIKSPPVPDQAAPSSGTGLAGIHESLHQSSGRSPLLGGVAAPSSGTGLAGSTHKRWHADADASLHEQVREAPMAAGSSDAVDAVTR